jgi:catechol 2,3-dioxygenase-like lactoylglutathione lyase family enzyme
MPSTRVTDLNVLTIYVTDLDRSTEFYREHLGFEKVEDLPPGVLMKAGKVTLYLEAGRRTRRPDSPPTAEFSPCFATESVKASYESLESAGVHIAHPYREFSPTFALFRISDPDGNLIAFAGAP